MDITACYKLHVRFRHIYDIVKTLLIPKTQKMKELAYIIIFFLIKSFKIIIEKLIISVYIDTS